MPIADTTVKFLHSGQQGAGASASGAGGWVAVLNKALINGFNLLTVDSVVVANNVATVTRASGHGYTDHMVITMAGATPSSLNREWRIKNITPTSFQFDTEGISDVSATGTITTKTSPLGWEQPFYTTTDATYRPTNPNVPRSYHRCVDTTTDPRTLTCYTASAMSAYNDTSNVWATATVQQRGTGWWYIIGDDATAYICTYETNYSRMQLGCIGAYRSFAPVDPYNDMGYGPGNSSGGSGSSICADQSDTDGGGGCTYSWTRDPSGTPTYRVDALGQFGGLVSGYGWDSATWALPVFPSYVDQGLLLSDLLIRQHSIADGSPIRGVARGAYWVAAHQPFATQYNPPWVTISGVSGLEGKNIAIVPSPVLTNTGLANCGRIAFDITGPWSL